jgi:hypothetical protein
MYDSAFAAPRRHADDVREHEPRIHKRFKNAGAVKTARSSAFQDQCAPFRQYSTRRLSANRRVCIGLIVHIVISQRYSFIAVIIFYKVEKVKVIWEKRSFQIAYTLV